MFRVCRRYTRSREDAEDMMQEVFLKVDKYTHEHPGEIKPVSWIYRMAVNRCLDYLRSQKSKNEVHLGFREFEALGIDPHDEDESLTRIALKRILRDADPMTQQCLLLTCVEGFTHEEAAGKLGVTREAVTHNLSRFHRKMTLGRDGIEPERCGR